MKDTQLRYNEGENDRKRDLRGRWGDRLCKGFVVMMMIVFYLQGEQEVDIGLRIGQ